MDNELANMVLSGSLIPGAQVVVGAGEEAGGGLTFDIVGAVKTQNVMCLAVFSAGYPPL